MYFRYSHPELKSAIVTVTALPYSLVFCIAEHLFPRGSISSPRVRLLLPRVKVITSEDEKYVMVSGSGTEFIPIEEYCDRRGEDVGKKIIEAVEWIDDNPNADVEEQVEKMAEIFSIRIICRMEEFLVYNQSEPVLDRLRRLNALRYFRKNLGTIEKGEGDEVSVWAVSTNEQEQELFTSRLECGCRELNAIKRALACSDGDRITQFIYEVNEVYEESSDSSSDDDESSEEEYDDSSEEESEDSSVVEVSDSSEDEFDLPPPSNRDKRRREGDALGREQENTQGDKNVVCPQCGGVIALDMMKEAIRWSNQSKTRKFIGCPHCGEGINLEEMVFAVRWAERKL